MTLQDQIKKDLLTARKAQDGATTAALRVIMGEFGRMASKILGDDDVIIADTFLGMVVGG